MWVSLALAVIKLAIDYLEERKLVSAAEKLMVGNLAKSVLWRVDKAQHVRRTITPDDGLLRPPGERANGD